MQPVGKPYGLEGLLDLHQCPAPSSAPAEIAVVMHYHGANDFENCLEDRPITTANGMLCKYVETSPPFLNRLVEFDDFESFFSERFVFPDRGTNLPVREIALIEHNIGWNEEWCSRQEFRLQPPRSKRGALYVTPRELLRMVRQSGSAPLPPQCQCDDLLLIYRREMPRICQARRK